MPRVKLRRGHLPTCYTEFARWAAETGYTSAYISQATGIHEVTVRRHWAGAFISARCSRDYRAAFPGIRGIPLRGRPQRYAYPLPLRKAPKDGPASPPGLTQGARSTSPGGSGA